MNKQYLLIYNYPALFNIFNELKHVLSFEVKNLSENEYKKLHNFFDVGFEPKRKIKSGLKSIFLKKIS